MSVKVLLVHGYGFVNEHNLGIQSETICRKVLKIHHLFDEIIFLGGWHNKKQSPSLTSGELMRGALVNAYWEKPSLAKAYVNRCKLHTVQELLPYGMPPRDTAEEVDDFLGILRTDKLPCLSESLRNNEVFAIGLWYHIPRIKLLYDLKLNELGKVNMIPVFSWQTIHPNQWLRIAQEPIGLIINWLDPNGEKSFVLNLRKQRTHHDSTA